MAVLRYRADGYRARHPHAADVLLVIEVADTSLDHDRDIKLPLYARAGIPEVWLVDLTGDRIAVQRDAGPDGYRDASILTRGDTLPDLEPSADEVLG